MILNLKHLNKFVEKMDTAHYFALITRNNTFMKFDFADAYYSCNVFPPNRKYLRFSFDRQLYEFTSLPTGLSSAPRFFTKIMKVALAHILEQGNITLSGFLDNNIVINCDSVAEDKKKGNFAAKVFFRN